MKRNVNLLISILLVFTGMLFFNIDKVNAETTQGHARCVYYLNEKNVNLYKYTMVGGNTVRETWQKSTDWGKDIRIIIDVWGTFKDGKTDPSGFKYIADCETGDRDSDKWEKGKCTLPSDKHVDKTSFASREGYSQLYTKMNCPSLAFNGVFYRNDIYDLDFTTNRQTAENSPLKPKQSEIKHVNEEADSVTTEDVRDKYYQKKIGESDKNLALTEVKLSELNCAYLGENSDDGFITQLANIFKVMQVAGIILLLVLSIWDFAQTITSGDNDRFQKVGKRFLHRIIAAVILLLLPVMIQSILSLAQKAGVEQIGGFCIEQFL